MTRFGEIVKPGRLKLILIFKLTGDTLMKEGGCLETLGIEIFCIDMAWRVCKSCGELFALDFVTIL